MPVSQSFAVFGHPIAHSKSPRIHSLFAEQTGISLTYERILAPLDGFDSSLKMFFQRGACGANVTAPFKERACAAMDELSERARSAGAVNTIQKKGDGSLYGDNTDGIGLLSDLQQNAFIQPHYRVLLVGAGGAARGVIQPLLAYGCELVIANRTFARAGALAEHFGRYGQVSALSMDALSDHRFDLIINATSSGVMGDIPDLPVSLISPDVCCYDMFYQAEPTPFLTWCIQQGAQRYVDGMGMLVWQAAHAFSLWHGIMPDAVPVIRKMKQELGE
ncbi:shikimate 5-dehydrogenase [Dickeya chrysanthemi Ech1591]|uniref:Shikimate dehydrogenase (NADP(+)) n=1 Tax=Dickeya chrysanthemi (strain Ech1591) TaxID=561229 RepID=C6CI05_DICC1|nr:shikimate dehydrogenase [Dickeya chrysanthemi]ACT05251.1 shikimate 5-dehydrogenase [Dickeya chrysanthemi Ech1591]